MYIPAMRLGGHHSGGGFGHGGLGGHMGHMGGRMAGLPTIIHIFGIFVLFMLGIAAAALARIAVRDWILRRYGKTGYIDTAGAAAVVFVVILAGFLALKILSF